MGSKCRLSGFRLLRCRRIYGCHAACKPGILDSRSSPLPSKKLFIAWSNVKPRRVSPLYHHSGICYACGTRYGHVQNHQVVTEAVQPHPSEHEKLTSERQPVRPQLFPVNTQCIPECSQARCNVIEEEFQHIQLELSVHVAREVFQQLLHG